MSLFGFTGRSPLVTLRFFSWRFSIFSLQSLPPPKLCTPVTFIWLTTPLILSVNGRGIFLILLVCFTYSPVVSVTLSRRALFVPSLTPPLRSSAVQGPANKPPELCSTGPSTETHQRPPSSLPTLSNCPKELSKRNTPPNHQAPPYATSSSSTMCQFHHGASIMGVPSLGSSATTQVVENPALCIWNFLWGRPVYASNPSQQARASLCPPPAFFGLTCLMQCCCIRAFELAFATKKWQCGSVEAYLRVLCFAEALVAAAGGLPRFFCWGSAAKETTGKRPKTRKEST